MFPLPNIREHVGHAVQGFIAQLYTGEDLRFKEEGESIKSGPRVQQGTGAPTQRGTEHRGGKRIRHGLTARSLSDWRKTWGGNIPHGMSLPMLPLPLRTNSLKSFHPLTSCWRSMTYIYGLLPQRDVMGLARGERGMFATNLSPAERGSLRQLGGIQLNCLLVSYHRSGSDRSATHS